MMQSTKVDMLIHERALLAEGFRRICGVDEAGRGPLAGPVMAAAVIPDLNGIVEGVNDSKKLTEKKREALYPQIIETALSFKTQTVSPQEIDRVNILQATKNAMLLCVEGLNPAPDYVLLDAVKLPLLRPSASLIHGDAVSYAIAAASILAKVERDRLMLRYAEEYPQYGFEQHKGYGTAHHIAMLKKFGPCPIHRKTFIRKFVGES